MSVDGDQKNSTSLQLLSRDSVTVVIESTVVIFLTVFSLLGNILVVLASFRNSRLRRSFYIYVVSLAISDIIMALLAMSFACRSVLVGKWDLGVVPCQVQGFVVAWCGFESILLMCLIAVSRYFKMIHPTKYMRVFTDRFFHVSNVCSWLALLCPLAVCSVYVEFSFNPGLILCSLDLDKIPFIIVFWMAFYGVNYNAIFFCYYKLWRFVKNHNAAMTNSQVNTEEVKTVRILFAVVFAFVLCVSPLFICGVVDALFGLYALPRRVYVTAVVFYGMSSCVNPVIYGYMNPTYRQEFRNILCMMNIWRYFKSNQVHSVNVSSSS